MKKGYKCSVKKIFGKKYVRASARKKYKTQYFHALPFRRPEDRRYFNSIKILDNVLNTGQSLQTKTIVLTGMEKELNNGWMEDTGRKFLRGEGTSGFRHLLDIGQRRKHF